MPDDIAFGLAHHIGDRREIRFTQGVNITVKILLYSVAEYLGTLIDGDILSPDLDIMHRADNVVKVVGRVVAVIILLHTAQDVNLIKVFRAQIAALGKIPRDIRFLHTVAFIKEGVAVSADTDGRQALFDGALHHFLGRVLAVAVAGMHMQVFSYHLSSSPA